VQTLRRPPAAAAKQRRLGRRLKWSSVAKMAWQGQLGLPREEVEKAWVVVGRWKSCR
jgi:hypothetical protein